MLVKCRALLEKTSFRARLIFIFLLSTLPHSSYRMGCHSKYKILFYEKFWATVQELYQAFNFTVLSKMLFLALRILLKIRYLESLLTKINEWEVKGVEWPLGLLLLEGQECFQHQVLPSLCSAGVCIDLILLLIFVVVKKWLLMTIGGHLPFIIFFRKNRKAPFF